MDLYRIISELIAERDRVVRIIQSLEAMETSPARTQTARKRGRKFMDSTARLEVSERMKRYWARRRKDAGELPKSEPAST